MNAKKLNNLIKTTKEPFAFILGKYATTGLGVARCFGRENISVLWLDSNLYQAGFLSKYCEGVLCPHILENEKEYVDFLLDIGKKINDKGVLFPISDIEVQVILKNKSKLEQYFHIPIADLNYTEILLNKQKFYQTLEKNKIPHPKTYFPNDVSNVYEICNNITFPCIIKPYHSEEFRISFNIKFFSINSMEELIKYYKQSIENNLKVMIQEIIPGDATHMYGYNAYFDENINPIGSFGYTRVREWPPISGNGVLIKNAISDEFENMITPYIKKINYHGIVDAEIKKDSRDKTYKLIEINPRCWMQVAFPMRYGINIPYIAYQDALGKIVNVINLNKEQINWLFGYQDISSAFYNIKKGNLSLGQWICSYKGKKEYSIFSWNDPLPFFRFICKNKNIY
jgi:predicted ATP-grasp superfamily ATP-dependent carboligase